MQQIHEFMREMMVSCDTLLMKAQHEMDKERRDLLNFSQIKCFLAAAEYLSFTKAAKRLYLSQPVVSRQIAAMEEALGMELFYREKKSLRLTPAGTVMAEGLEQLAGDYQVLVEKANAAHQGFAGQLNIGMIEGQQVCPPYSDALTKFSRFHPDIRVFLSGHTMAELSRALAGGEIDVAFGASFNLEDEEGLEHLVVGKASTRLVIPKDHPLANKENVRLSDFKEDTFLTLPEKESPYISRFAQYVGELGNFKPKTLEAPNIRELALWLEAGYGIFPLNENHSLRNSPKLIFKEIPEFADSVEIVMWKKDDPNPAIAPFLEQFEDM